MNVVRWIEDHQAELIEISNRIWESAEVGFQEIQSAHTHEQALRKAGFTVDAGVAGMPTALIGSYGTGKPIIAILGEYDALAGLSQDRVPFKKPLVDGAPGHGCGHNLLGTGSLAAALAVSKAIEAGDVKGTVRYYGCPAEEGGSGKAYMVKEGLFEDVDLALTWHPGSFNCAFNINVLAMIQVYFRFHGKTAHAAADPYNGRSALDAVELMNIGVNYLREHMIPDARIHYIITKGGIAPNVVPDLAESLYFIRAPQMSEAQALFERVQDIARGAALMTGTDCEIIFDAGTSSMILNDIIADVLNDKLLEIGAPQFSEEEIQFAGEIAKDLPKAGGMDQFSKLIGPEALKMFAQMQGRLLFDAVLPPIKSEAPAPGSSDVGDVSWVTPTSQFVTTCGVLGTPGHSWQQVAQGGMGIGHKGFLYAGKVLAATAVEFMTNPEKVKKARAEFEERTKDQSYVSPIMEGVKPPTAE